MRKIVIKGRGVWGGVAEGPAMVSRDTIQGWSGLDDETGVVIEKGHPFEGMSIKGAVLVLSGVTALADLPRFPYAPRHVLEGVFEIPD